MSLVYTVALVLISFGKERRYKQNTYLLPVYKLPALYLPHSQMVE